MFSHHFARFRAIFTACFAAAILTLAPLRFAFADSAGQETPSKTPMEVQISFSMVRSTPDQAKKHPHLKDLLEAGGTVFAAPSIRTLDDFAAEFKSTQQIPYMTGKEGQPRLEHLDTGLRVRLTPHVNPDKTVQLDFDADNSEPTSSKPLTVAKYGLFNSKRLKPGQETVLGTWMQQDKLVTVFVTVTLPPSGSAQRK